MTCTNKRFESEPNTPTPLPDPLPKETPDGLPFIEPALFRQLQRLRNITFDDGSGPAYKATMYPIKLMPRQFHLLSRIKNRVAVKSLNRQTGQTTRTLLRALQYIKDNPNVSVLFWAHSFEFIRVLQYLRLHYAEQLDIPPSELHRIVFVSQYQRYPLGYRFAAEFDDR